MVNGPATLAEVCPVLPPNETGSFAIDGISPEIAVRPETPEQVAAAVRMCAGNGWAIAPCGGGTSMSLGNTPSRFDVALCTGGLAEIVEYEPADLVVTVQAGIRLGELQRHLAEHGQCLPLDPPLANKATIGGVIAANSSGPIRLRHGTCRDMLLGVKVVDAGGNITKAGGKVVKNVTGYDMCKLYTGSLGTLGVIVEASFKLSPLPRRLSSVLAWYPEVTSAFAAARRLHGLALPLRACELLSPPAAAGVLAAPGISAAGDGYLLATWLAGSEAAQSRLLRDVQQACGPATCQVIDQEADAAFWRALEDFGRGGDYDTITRLSTVPSETEALLRSLVGSTFVARVLSGLTYVFGAIPPEAGARAVYRVFERLPLPQKPGVDVWGSPGEDFGLMQAVKREFDPSGIFNPGRFVGGL
ncbi:MAG: FAD-binding oxidoreductase [Chloroflexi bacterium]|nr:FAD-binding oxidoreductase [Chloroflexota bacterium]